jgi:hypothetical protein
VSRRAENIVASMIALFLLALSANITLAQSPQENAAIENSISQASVSSLTSCLDQASPSGEVPQPLPILNVNCSVYPPDANKIPAEEITPAAAPILKDPPKRMFGMIPDFESANNTVANRNPLTVRQKYSPAFHQSFDFSAYIGDAFQSGIQQITNGQPHYGRGWAAYDERFMAAQADQTSSSVLIYGALPAALHEDPRIFRGTGSAASRLWYAVNGTFVGRRVDGTSGLNRSQILGQLASCGISTSYYPTQDRSVDRVLLNWIANLGYNSGYNILAEYYTDILQGLLRHRKMSTLSPSTAQSPINAKVQPV